MRYFITVIWCLISFTSNRLFATHNRAGEISFVQLSDLKIQILITTYTKASSTAADRDSLVVSWGDGSLTTVARSNGSGDILSNNTKRNYYTSEHIYPGRATYVISVMDPNRVENILNIDPPNSVNIPFFIQTTVTLLNLQFQSPNRSVRLLQAPIDFACIGIPFQHNPAAFDEDGDSLSFEFTVPLMDVNTPVPNYIFPNQILPGVDNSISLDPNKGTLTWISPKKAGEYNIAFIIHEYRKGVKIASTIRDMQIFVRDDCKKNTPPIIQAIFDTCIVAGQLLDLPILISDADTAALGSKIKVEATGAPFFFQPGMVFSESPVFQNSPIAGRIMWQTDCSLIRKEPYTVVIKGTDNVLDTTGISTLHTIQIKIVGPAPLNLVSKPVQKKIHLEWNDPYACSHHPENFKGFSIWRKENPLSLPHDTCNPGLSGKSYIQIAYLILQSNGLNYFFIDTQITEGKFYCYRVQAEFAKTSSTGFPINFVSSLHSNETCNTLPLNIPVLLNVDIEKTGISDGEINLRWTKPVPSEFDTTFFPPPYQTEILYNTSGQQQWQTVPGTQNVYSNYTSIVDTVGVHKGLNTQNQNYQYYIQLVSGKGNIHVSDSAQSIFLSAYPVPNALDLSWRAKTPWNNYKYDIFLYNGSSQSFDSIGSTSNTTFRVQSLLNDSLYCVYVKAYGAYGVSRFESPLFNRSNVACTRPHDNQPPCCPLLTVEDPCQSDQVNSGSPFVNQLKWQNQNGGCFKEDIAGYNIYAYYQNNRSLIATIPTQGILTYEHSLLDSVPECYAVTAFDSLGNECMSYDSVCIAYCPVYRLPNTFTPNQDGHNDVFKPFPYRFVKSIEMQIFNRWGNLVYQTTDPDILWDGKATDQSYLPDGTYYYSCRIQYSGLPNNLPDSQAITGFIELRKGKN